MSNATKMKTYKIRVATEQEDEMLRLIKLNKWPGFFWPHINNTGEPQFEITMTTEEFLVLKLMVPCRVM